MGETVNLLILSTQEGGKISTRVQSLNNPTQTQKNTTITTSPGGGKENALASFHVKAKGDQPFVCEKGRPSLRTKDHQSLLRARHWEPPMFAGHVTSRRGQRFPIFPEGKGGWNASCVRTGRTSVVVFAMRGKKRSARRVMFADCLGGSKGATPQLTAVGGGGREEKGGIHGEDSFKD